MDRFDSGWSGLASAPAGDSDRGGELARRVARLFATPDGEALLAHLRKLTLDRCLGPESTPDALRHLEGQRHLVLNLLALAARGRDGR